MSNFGTPTRYPVENEQNVTFHQMKGLSDEQNFKPGQMDFPNDIFSLCGASFRSTGSRGKLCAFVVLLPTILELFYRHLHTCIHNQRDYSKVR